MLNGAKNRSRACLILCGVGAVLHAVLQLRQGDGGKCTAHRPAPPGTAAAPFSRLVLHHIDTDVGVKHIGHRLSRSSWAPWSPAIFKDVLGKAVHAIQKRVPQGFLGHQQDGFPQLLNDHLIGLEPVLLGQGAPPGFCRSQKSSLSPYRPPPTRYIPRYIFCVKNIRTYTLIFQKERQKEKADRSASSKQKGLSPSEIKVLYCYNIG